MIGVDAVVAHVAELLESFGVAAGSRAEVETYLRGVVDPVQAAPSGLQSFVLDEVNDMIDSLDETVTQEDMGRVLFELRDAVRDGTWQSPAEPVSIPDMAPGTRFEARTAQGYLSDWTWLGEGRVMSGMGIVRTYPVAAHGDTFDESTIRHVTPPPATPETGR